MTTARGTGVRRLGGRGTATIEFALIAPTAVCMMLGAVELIHAFRAQAKVHTMSGQLAELIAGSASITAPGGSLADLCTGAALNLLPYSRNAVSAQIASISVDHPANRVAGSTDSVSVQVYLDWESGTACPQPAGGTLGLGGAFALANRAPSMLTRSGAPASDINDPALSYGSSAVIVVVRYRYSNAVMFLLDGLLSFSSVTVARPRANTTVKCTGVAGAPCPQFQ